MAIASREELAGLLQRKVDNYTADLVLSMAEGLVTDIIGDQSPTWPLVAKSVCLAAALRPYRNPDALVALQLNQTRQQYNPEEVGVYLTASEEARLQQWLSNNEPDVTAPRSPAGSFPDPLCYPDPADNTYGVWTTWPIE